MTPGNDSGGGERAGDDVLLRAERVAELLDVSARAVEQWEKAGRIPRAVVNRHKFKRWSRNEIQRHIEQMKQEQACEAAS